MPREAPSCVGSLDTRAEPEKEIIFGQKRTDITSARRRSTYIVISNQLFLILFCTFWYPNGDARRASLSLSLSSADRSGFSPPCAFNSFIGIYGGGRMFSSVAPAAVQPLARNATRF